MNKIKELYKNINRYKNNKAMYIGIGIAIFCIWSLMYKAVGNKDIIMLKRLLVLYILILIGMFIIYFNDIFSYRCNQYRKLKNLKYFKILEKNAKTDAKKRQELGRYIKDLFWIHYFLLLFILLPVKVIFELNDEVAIFIIGITILGVCLSLLKYNTFPFYILPLVVILLRINTLDYSLYNSICKVIIEILIWYLFLLLIYPAVYLRKLEKNVTIMAGLVVVLITLGIQACLELYNSNNLTIIDRNSLEKLLGMKKSLIILAYSLGGIIIKLRLYYFDKRAEKYYNKLLYDMTSKDKKEIYNICKYCVFYGGESYKNRILDNKVWREIICEIEQSYLQELFQNSENNYFINITKRMKSIFKK